MPNLVGIGNSQVPTNAMLGGLAYKDSVDVEVISKIQTQIAAPIYSGGALIRGMFLYDTRKDSDAGAWRFRTQHTSWYNEGANKYRGRRKEFPAVALIVAIYDTLNRVVIYDADDPNMSMWMMYERNSSQQPYFNFAANGANHLGNYEPFNVSALNGTICVATQRPSGHLGNLNAGLRMFRFIEDDCIATNDNRIVKFTTPIAQRNDMIISYYNIQDHNQYNEAIVSSNALSVDMVVLPGAPIDGYTKLPIPTIAVGTEGGVSIMRDTGDTVDLGYTSTNDNNRGIILTKSGKVRYLSRSLGTNSPGGGNFFIFSYTNPVTDGLGADSPDLDYSYGNTGNGLYKLTTQWEGDGGGGTTKLTHLTKINDDEFAVGSNEYGAIGFHRIIEPKTPSHDHVPVPMINKTGKDYNTGWFVGNNRGVWCCDTSTTNATATNLITNGTFDSNTTGWSAGNGATLTATGGKLKIESTQNNSYAYQTVTTVAYRAYVLTLDFPTDGNASLWVRIGTGGAASVDLINANAIAEGSQHLGYNFVATSTSTTISLMISQSGSGKTVYVDNVVLQVGEADRSVYRNNLAVMGTVPKNKVATGSDLVAYGPFSSSNLLYYPTNSHGYGSFNDYELGTYNDFYISGWFKASDATPSSDNDFFARTDAGPQNAIFLQIRTNGSLRFYTKDANGDTFTDTNAVLKDNTWYHFVAIRTHTGNQIYLNGEYTVNTSSYSTTNNATPRDVGTGRSIYIGGRHQTGQNYCTTTQVALIRWGDAVPSFEQVKKMYNDEKQFFVDHAKCTLYGTSNEVKGMAYDDGTDILHVGTSSGRSDFDGLTRINNTTTPVTTAIVASNGLIVEE